MTDDLKKQQELEKKRKERAIIEKLRNQSFSNSSAPLGMENAISQKVEIERTIIENGRILNNVELNNFIDDFVKNKA